VLRLAATLSLACLLAAGCGSAERQGSPREHGARTPVHSPGRSGPGTPAGAGENIYSTDRADNFAAAVRGDRALVYVPNSVSDTVTVISQRTLKAVATFHTGALPQHVTPSYDLRTLYVDNDLGNTLTPIDPRTGRPGRPIPVRDPYNLYFAPDGRYAIVVAERLQLLDFRDPHTMRLEHSLPVAMCRGVDHMDFSADGRFAYASCEFSGRVIEIDLRTLRVVRTLLLGDGQANPQDVKLSPDGRTLYTADMASGGVWEIDPGDLRLIGFLRTGAGAHGLYASRDARVMYVSNREAGSISLVSFKTRRVVATWQIPPPASPDMGNVSADGRTLWLSGRYNDEVYAIDTRSGRLRARIPVGEGPTACACGHSPDAIRLATPASCAERPPCSRRPRAGSQAATVRRRTVAHRRPGPRHESHRCEALFDLRLGYRANHSVDLVAVAHHHEKGDAHRAEAGSQRGILVHVDLDYLERACPLAGELREHGLDHPAGSAPGGPEVDEHRHARVGLGDEARLVSGHDPRQWRLATRASRRPARRRADPVLGRARRAREDRRHGSRLARFSGAAHGPPRRPRALEARCTIVSQ
jgi:YVTN family beta-propeller protein